MRIRRRLRRCRPRASDPRARSTRPDRANPDGTIAAYSLSFGDGHSADFTTSLTASHAYATGTFTATLSVQDNGGAVAVRTTTVTVTNILPVATFTYACDALTCGFDGSGAADVDGNIQYYGWTFGDGSAGSGATTSHRYAAAGTYVVTLIGRRQQRRDVGREPNAKCRHQSTGRPHDARGRPGSRGGESADGLDRGRHRHDPRRRPHAACGCHRQRLLEQRPDRVVHDQRGRPVHAVERRDSEKDWQHHVHGR